jgi:hypothetical protein
MVRSEGNSMSYNLSSYSLRIKQLRRILDLKKMKEQKDEENYIMRNFII